MNFQFGGEFQVTQVASAVFNFLSNPEKFAPLLPDFQKIELQDASHALVTLRVGVAHIRGNAAIRLTRKESEPSWRAVYEGTGDLPGGTATLTAAFELEELPGATRVKWMGQGQIMGRLPSLAGGLLEPLARKNVQKLVDALREALCASPTDTSRKEKAGAR